MIVLKFFLVGAVLIIISTILIKGIDALEEKRIKKQNEKEKEKLKREEYLKEQRAQLDKLEKEKRASSNLSSSKPIHTTTINDDRESDILLAGALLSDLIEQEESYVEPDTHMTESVNQSSFMSSNNGYESTSSFDDFDSDCSFD